MNARTIPIVADGAARKRKREAIVTDRNDIALTVEHRDGSSAISCAGMSECEAQRGAGGVVTQIACVLKSRNRRFEAPCQQIGLAEIGPAQRILRAFHSQLFGGGDRLGRLALSLP